MMTPRAHTILFKLFSAAFFLVLLYKVSEAPPGHFDPAGSKFAAPLLILFCGGIVISGKWKRAHVHLAWGCFCLTVFLSTYRLYRYHELNDEMQRDQMIRDAEKFRAKHPQKEPNQTPEPTPLAVTIPACAGLAPSSVVAHL